MSTNNSSRIVVDVVDVHEQVTGSCHLVIVKLPIPDEEGNAITIKKFIVDCGLFQGNDDNENQNLGDFPFEPNEIEFALMTHHHVDHYGRFPLLIKKGFNSPILTTKTTKKLLPIGLPDCLNVTKKAAKRTHTAPLYDEDDVKQMMRLTMPFAFNDEIPFDDTFSIWFFKNGHLPGAAVILVKISCEETDPVYLLFTGDYHYKNMFFDVPELPDWVKELPITVICEATYGDMTTCDLNQPCFEKNVESALKLKKTVLCPVFSLGRAQEVLFILKKMQDAGKIPHNVNIYLDGYTSQAYTILYRNGTLFKMTPYAERFLPNNLLYVVKRKEPKQDPYPPTARPNKKKKKKKPLPQNMPKKISQDALMDNLLDLIPDELKVERNNIIEDNHRKIIVSSSGSGSYGPSQTYIQNGISKDNYLIHFTGYIFPDSHGAVIANAKIGETVALGGILLKKRAEVLYTSEFSAHAKSDELIDFLKKFTNLKSVLINHGETETKNAFAEKIMAETNVEKVGILNSTTIIRLDSTGIIISMSDTIK